MNSWPENESRQNLNVCKALKSSEKLPPLNFDFENTPKRFLDVETGEHIDLYSENIKEAYAKSVSSYFEALKLKCAQYKIKYVDVDVRADFSKVLNTYLAERKNFL